MAGPAGLLKTCFDVRRSDHGTRFQMLPPRRRDNGCAPLPDLRELPSGTTAKAFRTFIVRQSRRATVETASDRDNPVSQWNSPNLRTRDWQLFTSTMINTRINEDV